MYKISQVSPYIDMREGTEILKSIEAKWLTEGPAANEFVDKIKEFTGAKYAYLAPNGTLGLYLALLSLGLERDSEVLVPDFTFMASAASVVFANLKPKIVPVMENDFSIDVNKLEEFITPNTKAIMPVHIYGQSCDISKVCELAEKYSLKVIEDAAQGFGVSSKNRHLGTIGDVGVISFYADKTITMGEGAIVLTNNEQIAHKLRLIRNQGRPNSGTFIHPELGMNFRVTDIQCAIGLAQLEKFEEIKLDRIRKYERYMTNLAGVGDLTFLNRREDSTFCPFRFTIKTNSKSKMVEYLEGRGIQTRTFFYPLHLQPCLEGIIEKVDFKQTINLFNTGICFPVHWEMTLGDVDYISSVVEEFFDNLF